MYFLLFFLSYVNRNKENEHLNKPKELITNACIDFTKMLFAVFIIVKSDCSIFHDTLFFNSDICC